MLFRVVHHSPSVLLSKNHKAVDSMDEYHGL
jgi:hypothetical protein